jgi:aminopeptidase N
MLTGLPRLLLLLPLALQAQVTHYDVKLTVDPEARVLRGRETIRFQHQPGHVQFQKQAGLKLSRQNSTSLKLAISDTSVEAVIPDGETHTISFDYTAAAARGLRWLAPGPGLFTTFYCEAWMICSTSPDRRATLRLEIVVPDDALRAVGPGALSKHWRDSEGSHWLFETPTAVQTYLLSFAVAPLIGSVHDRLEIYAPTPGHSAALRHTTDAAQFYRQRTGVDAIAHGYRQVFLPQKGTFGQEAAGLALMTDTYLQKLESADDVVLMAHELAHQWWGVSVAIRSWSDFWLNEGVCEYVSLLYLEHSRGRDAFLEAIGKLRTRMDELRTAGRDRPLHFEGWKDAADALGPLPYVKGALFLHRLRTEVGDELFWHGLAIYTRRHAGQLVDSADFQRDFQEATRRDLSALFGQQVFGR